MTRNILVLFMAIFWSCSSQTQSINKEIIKEGQQPFLLGKIDKVGLTSSNYSSWFSSQYQEYEPDDEFIKKSTKKLKDYTILVFMGTWCGDSRREVPRFYKILEAANFPVKQLTTIAVSRAADLYKQSPQHEEKGLNIHRVPTFIFYKKGKEVNRIVEHPVRSLEEDVFNILHGNYQPNYSVVNDVDMIINDTNFYKKAVNLIPTYKEKVKSMYELNTYSRVLASTNKKDRAIEVLQLNTQLFPENPATYVSLANFHYKLDQKNRALKNYEKALKINPENTKVKNRINQLKSELTSSNN